MYDKLAPICKVSKPVDLFPPKAVNLHWSIAITFRQVQKLLSKLTNHAICSRFLPLQNVSERRLWPDFEVVLLACPNNFCPLGSLQTGTVMALSGTVCKYSTWCLCGSSNCGMSDSLSRGV